jgi:hypothetical protein
MPLTHLHVLNVCKIGTENECKYLIEDEISRDKFFCLKLSSQKTYAENSAQIKIKRAAGSINVINSANNCNCAGYPILQYKFVGYDQK